jgi:thioesterase domain-containing protein
MKLGEEHDEERARTEIAAKISQIWARVVARPDVDEHTDFYFHGGNHFLAPVMIQSINDELGLELTTWNLEQARTIAKLTDLIYFEQTRIDHSTVVPLRHIQGSRPPLFAVHGVAGNVLGFYSLAKCLDANQPVYGIQAQSLLPGREALLSLEQMAAEYVADMRAVYPNGPYHLLGYSFGGLVAYEIAQQLRAAGLEVGLLGMLDTRPPDLMRQKSTRRPLLMRILWRLHLLYLRTHRRNGRLRYLWRRLRDRVQRVNYMYAANKGTGKVVSAARNVREINYVASVSYSVRPYPGKVTLFRAEPDPSEDSLPPDLNWGQVAMGGVDIKHLPGDHGRVLYQPGLDALAAELTAALREVEAANAAMPPRVDSSELLSGRVSMEI